MKKGNVVFKAYTMDQPSLLPANLEELIPEDHLVRVVNRVVEGIDLEPLMAKYAGGGTSSYHPKMMLKVLVYAYCKKVFTSRRIARQLQADGHLASYHLHCNSTSRVGILPVRRGSPWD